MALCSPNSNLKYCNFRFPEVFIKTRKNKEPRSWHIHSYEVLHCWEKNGPSGLLIQSTHSIGWGTGAKWLVQGHAASWGHMQERKSALMSYSSTIPTAPHNLPKPPLFSHHHLSLLIVPSLLEVHSLIEETQFCGSNYVFQRQLNDFLKYIYIKFLSCLVCSPALGKTITLEVWRHQKSSPLLFRTSLRYNY